jgi:hypothetical protein
MKQAVIMLNATCEVSEELVKVIGERFFGPPISRSPTLPGNTGYSLNGFVIRFLSVRARDSIRVRNFSYYSLA